MPEIACQVSTVIVKNANPYSCYTFGHIAISMLVLIRKHVILLCPKLVELGNVFAFVECLEGDFLVVYLRSRSLSDGFDELTSSENIRQDTQVFPYIKHSK